MVGSNGVEPSTFRLSAERSDQLSYEPMSSAAIAFINTKRWTLKIKQCTNMNASNNIHGTHISLTIR